MTLKIAKLKPRAIIPSRGSVDAAGLDLSYCPADNTPDSDVLSCGGRVIEKPCGSVILKPGGRVTLGTGIGLSLPPNTYGRVAPRSGLASKYGVDVLAGVVDRDYRGEIKIILIRSQNEVGNLEITPGMRIAQLIVEQCLMLQPVEVESVSDLEGTLRGDAGFGSTGS